MKKSVIALAGAMLISTHAWALESSAGLALQGASDYGLGTALVLSVSEDLKTISKELDDKLIEGFGIQVEFTKTLIKPSKTVYDSHEHEVDYTTLSPYVTYAAWRQNRLRLSARAGVIFINRRVTHSSSTFDVDLSTGGRGSYALMNNIELYVDVTLLRASELDVFNLGAGASFRF